MMAKDAHTPGPWAWYGKGNCNDLWLGTVNNGRRFVMGFKRWGAQGAQPVFQQEGRLVPAKVLITFEVGDGSSVGMDAAKANGTVYRFDIEGIDHPNARLIAAAPELLEACVQMLRDLDASHEPGVTSIMKMSAAIAKARGES